MGEVNLRYIIDDVPAAIEFYTSLLGFALVHDASPAFAAISRGGVKLLLSGDGSSGKRALDDGRQQTPGGWNRLHIEVSEIGHELERLKAAGVVFRTPEIVSGPGGSQIIIEDPSGNPVELFEPGSRRG